MKVLSLVALMCLTVLLAYLVLSIAAPYQQVSVQRIPVGLDRRILNEALISHSDEHPALIQSQGRYSLVLGFKVEAAPEGCIVVDSITRSIPFGARAIQLLFGPPELAHVDAAWVNRAVQED